jgi:hypothetical protein
LYRINTVNEIMPDTETLVREADILADCYEDIRSLLKFYLMRAKDVDPHRVYMLDGKAVNSLYWLTGHLAWSQHHLLIEAMGGEPVGIGWLERFEIGSQPEKDGRPAGPELPTFEEVRVGLDTVHERAMLTVRALTSEALGEPNAVGITFRAGDAKRVIIRHAIRHEPCHIGQIGWLIKAAGGETI